MPPTFYGTSVGQSQYNRGLSAIYKPYRVVYDPDYSLRQDYDIFDKYRREPVIAHAMTYRKHLVTGRNYNCQPASINDNDKQIAVLFEEIISHIDRFNNSLFNLAEAIFRGSAYAFVEGRRIYLKLPHDSVERWWWIPFKLRDVDRRRFRQVVDEAGYPYWQLYSIKRERYEKLEHPEWFIKHIYDDTEASIQYGRGLDDAIYYYFYAKAVTLEQGLQGLERWAQSLLIGKIDSSIPGNVNQTAQSVAQTMIEKINQMRSQHTIVIDKRDELIPVTGGGEGWQIVKEMLAYLDNALRILILGSNLPVSATEGGSYALASVQQNSTDALIQFDRKLLAETINKDLFKLIWNLNRFNFIEMGLQQANTPEFQITDDKQINPLESAQVISTVLQSGIPLRKDEVYERLGFSIPQANDEVIQRPEQIAPQIPQLPFKENRVSFHPANGNV